jgi:hypothetical protein
MSDPELEREGVPYIIGGTPTTVIGPGPTTYVSGPANPYIVGSASTIAGTPEFRAAFEEEYRLHHTSRGLWWRYAGVAFLSALLTFAITWAIAASRPVTVTLSAPKSTATSTAGTNAGANAGSNAGASSGATASSEVLANKVVASASNTGQVALSETQLRTTVKSIGSSIYWAGSLKNALYTLNHIAAGQDFIRYLPNGKGLNDVTQNYRVIATYRDPNAYSTVTAAAKISAGGVSQTNPDGSFVYYAKATPTHVYLVYKTVPYQIEIFDPSPGASLKMATTPGIISAIL